jgi:preprotein translocase SecE subunit
MATAEKTIAEPTPQSPHIQLAISSFLGAVFVLFSVYMVLAGIPYLWVEAIKVQEQVNPFLSGALLILVEIGAIFGFIFLGRHLEGPHPQHGLRAGIFYLCFFFLIALWITNKVAWMFAPPSYEAGMCVAATVVIFGALTFLVVWLYRKPGFAKWLQDREDKGWFHATAYKPNQGLRVRRCTVVALLVLGGCGIWTLERGLGRDLQGPNDQVISNDWTLQIPFMGQAGAYSGLSPQDYETRGGGGVTILNDPPVGSPAARAGLKKGFVVTQADEEKINSQDKLSEMLKSKRPNEVIKLTGDLDKEKLEVRILLASGHPVIPILYKVHLTLPIILAVLLIWLSWRVVNLPTFGDFLIATEAEMNKVSWTSGKRLRQDTVVVLVTVIILSMFLFVIDLIWITVLSWNWVGVLRVDVRQEALKQQEKTQW